MKKRDFSFVFFGTPHFAVSVLDELKDAGLTPALIVTAPDRPQGRGLTLTPPPVKEWTLKEGLDVLQPEKIADELFLAELANSEWDFFVVAAYGKILPKSLIEIPKYGTLNVHPSLLPRLRGASPIESAILTDEHETGVTIMLMDEEMDHGPILAQARIEIDEWPPKASVLEALLAHEGGKLLAETIPLWVADSITPEPQNHAKATFCKKITKEDGLIDLAADPYQNFRKVRALEGWPGTYFFAERDGKKIRVKITDAKLAAEEFRITRVIPEGKREMNYEDFLRGK